MKNVIFYKFMELTGLENIKESQYEICRRLGLLGKVILAGEGINGCLLGTEENINRYISEMKKDERFNDIDFKITDSQGGDFRRIWVKIKPQIITTRQWDADLKKKAQYIEPHELKELLDKGEEVYIVDARNDYEYESGHFKDAIHPGIRRFSHFPELAKKLEKYKDKKIVTYCTGGIRCEKASAYLRENGFKEILQLHGGVIRYGQECGNAHWEGSCFVFDYREQLDMQSIKK